MKAILKRHWQIKVVFTGIWLVYFSLPDVVDYTRDPSPPWLFYSTLPALVICLAWANQNDILKRNSAGIPKYISWAGDILGDIIVFALTLLVPLLVYSIFSPFVDSYTRRSYNSVMVISASSLRNAVTLAADKSRALIGAGKGVVSPDVSRLIDFSHITDDGVILLHSHKTESTLMFIPCLSCCYPQLLHVGCCHAPEYSPA